MTTHANISVVIPTVVREKPLERLLESIRTQDKLPKEIIIVTPKQKNIESFLKHSKIFDSIGVGFSQLSTGVANVQIQKKEGTEHAKYRYICFLDDDVVLDCGFFIYIEEAFSKFGPKIGGVQPYIESFRNDNGFKKFIKRITLLNRSFGNGSIMLSGFPQACFQEREPREIEFLFGSCCYKTEILRNKNYFDEKIGATHLWEDVFLSSKVFFDGNHFLYFPKARMTHYHEPGGRRTRKSFIASYVFNHFLLWNSFIPKNLLTYLCFYWSKICYWFLFTLQSVKQNNLLETQKGFLKGTLWLRRYKKTGDFPLTEEIEIN